MPTVNYDRHWVFLIDNCNLESIKTIRHSNREAAMERQNK